MIKSIIVQWAKEHANNMNNSWTNIANLTEIKRKKRSKSQESFAGQQFNAIKLNSYSEKKVSACEKFSLKTHRWCMKSHPIKK